MPTFPGATFLTAGELAAIRADLASAVDNTNMGAATVTFIRRSVTTGSASFDPATGTVTGGTSSKSVTCLVGSLSPKDITAFKGVALDGSELKFLIDRNDLDADPTTEDRVVHASSTYEVLRATISFTRVCSVVVRLLGGQ